jgi:hypothetical protein
MITLKHLRNLGIGLILLITLRLGYQYLYRDPYNRFLDSVDDVRPMFDELNDSILEQLPPPEGVLVKETGHGHGGSQYGPYLYATYDTNQAIPMDEVRSYYDEILLSNGWEKFSEFRTSMTVYRKTSCISIGFLSEELYDISIWHDFLKQDFSPQPPAQWVMVLHDFGERGFQRCPPK